MGDNDYSGALERLLPDSDRVKITIRMTKDGHLEILDSTGRNALVFFENGSWWGRRYRYYYDTSTPYILKNAERESFDNFHAACSYAFDPGLTEIRNETRGL